MERHRSRLDGVHEILERSDCSYVHHCNHDNRRSPTLTKTKTLHFENLLSEFNTKSSDLAHTNYVVCAKNHHINHLLKQRPCWRREVTPQIPFSRRQSIVSLYLPTHGWSELAKNQHNYFVHNTFAKPAASKMTYVVASGAGQDSLELNR